MPGPKDINTAYTVFQRQHPRPRPSEHETPNDGGTTQGEPTPSAEGWTAPTILLLAPNGHKHATRTVQRHHAPWSIPKHNGPETDVPPVRHSDQGIPGTCWHCGPVALDTPHLRLPPQAQAIITQGIGVFAAPLLQFTQITARTAQGNPIYVYHPTAIARLPIPSDTDIIYFTHASGTQQRTPTVGCASMRITRHADGLHVEHHTGATIFGASSHGELRTMADAVTATPPPMTIWPRNIWVVVDATVDIHLTRRLADLPLHKALESGLTTQALGLWMAFKGMHPQDALHIVKQESHRYAYGNGRADTQAKHQNTNHTPGLERVRLDTPHHSHLQHLPPIPPATQPPQ